MYCSNYGSDVVERAIILLVNDPRSQRNSTTNWREYISSPLSLATAHTKHKPRSGGIRVGLSSRSCELNLRFFNSSAVQPARPPHAI